MGYDSECENKLTPQWPEQSQDDSSIVDSVDDDEIDGDESDTSPEIWHVLNETLAGERIDRFVTDKLIERNISRSQVQGWVTDGAITVNGATVKPNYRIKADDVVSFTEPKEDDIVIIPENIPLDIVYEDDDIIVVNKARGMVVHPALGHHTGTLVNALMYHSAQLSRINGEGRQGIVHRIDKDTSGLLVVAKNDDAHLMLTTQLKERTMLRKYVALVHGEFAHQVGTIEAPIGRDPLDRKLFAVTATNSKEAMTHFNVLEMFKDYTLVELKLHTGRTHQIRVHMKFIEHPLVGDPLYGRSKGLTMNGQALHASGLGLVHPTTNEYMTFEAPLPTDMVNLLHELRAQA